MPHQARASPARNPVLCTIAMACALHGGAASSADPGEASLDSSNPATWPRLALNEALQTASTIEHPHRRAQALEQIVATTIGLGDCAAARAVVVDAIRAAHAITDASLRDLALRDIAYRQAACGDVAGALATQEEISSAELRDAVSMTVISAQLAAGDLPAALTKAHAIADPFTMSEAERLIALAHARRGDLAEARSIAGHIPDFLVRAMASADIAALHADVGNAKALNTARLIARNTPNARQRDVALSYVAGIQAQSGDVHGALATSATIKDGTSKAFALTRIANGRMGTADDAAVADLLERAFSTARKAKPNAATPAVLCEIAQAFVQRGDLHQARAALDHALTLATSKRSPRYGATTFEKIARTRARSGDTAGALVIAEGIADGSSQALLIHDILAAQAERGDVAGALKTSATLGDARLQAAALFGIVGVQKTSGDLPGARASLSRILQLARDTPDPGFRSHSLSAVAAAQVELGDRAEAWPNFQEALAAAAAVPDAYARAFAYVNLSDPFTQRP